MRLYLIRHGESVDNVAGLYAGSRDSELTAHGVLQARRLGAHLADGHHEGSDATSVADTPHVPTPPAASVAVTHIFSSDLQRASLTAQAVLDAQHKKAEKRSAEATGGDGEGEEQKASLELSLVHARTVVKLADLRERDFRSGEGVRFGSGSDSRNAFTDAETREEMRMRADRFVDGHLHPLLEAHMPSSDGAADNLAIVVVAHGLILNVLLSSLLQRFAPSELARLLPPALPGDSQQRMSDLRVPWNNTGYVQMSVETYGEGDVDRQVRLKVFKVNCVDHLQGLKKTRGGIGSAKFDAKQKTMDAFFGPAAKRQKKG